MPLFRPVLAVLFFSVAVICSQAQPPPTPPVTAGKTPVRPTPAIDTVPAEPVEDWSVLSIRGLHLDPRPVFLVQHDVKEKYTRDLVRVQWRANDSIELFVFTPRGVKKAPAILYLYSYPSENDRFYGDGWAERATSDGFAAVGFVSALTGQRYHMRPMKQWFVSELQESLATSTHDVQMVLDYLAQRGDIDMDRIGMFGQGSGGAIAVLAAQADPRIKALDLMNPWGDWPDWLKDSPQVTAEERPNYLKPEFLDKVKNLEPVLYLPHLRVASLRIQQISSDIVVPKAAMEKIASSAPSPDDVSRYRDPSAHYAAMRGIGVSGWLKEQLKSAAAPAGSQAASGQANSGTSQGNPEPR